MKDSDGFHNLKVIEQNFIPNKEEPKRVEITVETDVNGESIQKTMRFKPSQVSEGRWEKHFISWIEKQEKSRKIPDLKGENVKNSGYDHTGPEREYPER